MSELEKKFVFPEGFIWSCATSSFQIEGAVNEDGRGPSIWDIYQRKEGSISDGSTADVACDSYHKYTEDVKLLKWLGVQQYRFSISWSRILPTGRPDKVNEAGVRYYHRLIDLLIANNIEPMVTMYHWDLPAALGDRGGWLNGDCIKWFIDYARFLFQQYGSKVKKWITINQPWSQALGSYNGDEFVLAPGKMTEVNDWSQYHVGHTMLLAHGKTYRMYEEEFKELQKGQIGIANMGIWFEPHTDSQEDKAAAMRAMQMQFGWFCNPIFSKNGDYPEIMRKQIEELSLKEGRVVSRLPSFTDEEISMLRGSADFLGLNYYFSQTVRQRRDDELDGHIRRREWDSRTADEKFDPRRTRCGDSIFPSYPCGLRRLLNFIKEEYENPIVMITENGTPQNKEDSDYDLQRMEIIRDHLEEVQKAISQDHCNVIGYTTWSLMDNFEWSFGYDFSFGLFAIDFRDSERRRRPRATARWYKKCACNNCVHPVLSEKCMLEDM